MGFITSSLPFQNFSLISIILFGINGTQNELSGIWPKRGSFQYWYVVTEKWSFAVLLRLEFNIQIKCNVTEYLN